MVIKRTGLDLWSMINGRPLGMRGGTEKVSVLIDTTTTANELPSVLMTNCGGRYQTKQPR